MNWILNWQFLTILALIVGIVSGVGIQQIITKSNYDKTIRFEVIETRGFTQIQSYKGDKLLGARTITKEISPKGFEIEFEKENDGGDFIFYGKKNEIKGKQEGDI